MKTRIGIIFLILSLIFAMSGCKSQEVKPSSEMVEKQEPETYIVKAVENDPRTKDYPTKLREFSFDFDSDNEEEQIELYTAAGRDEKGRMMWDDGQNWLLVVVDKDKYYTLHSGYIQLGQLYFTVSAVGDERVPHVNVLLDTGCGTRMTDFTYNKDSKEFTGKVVYLPQDQNINQVYTSIPGY